MEFLAGLYTLLLVTICLLLAAVLWKLNKPRNGGDYEELKRWMQQQLDAQAKDFAARQAAMAEQNYTAIRSVSETLQTSVQSMSTTLAQGQSGQQQILTQRLQSLEAANTQKLEELRKTLAENMTALQAENAKKLDEIRHTVDEQLQDALQKRVTESFKAVNDQLEQVYKGLGEMQNLAADVGGLKQVLSGVKTRGILGEIQLGAILEEILAPEQYETNVATIPGSTQRVEYAIKMPGTDGGTVWLPIDSKFPGDTYAHLQDAHIWVIVAKLPNNLAALSTGNAGIGAVAYQCVNHPFTVDGHVHHGVALGVAGGLERDNLYITPTVAGAGSCTDAGPYLVVAVGGICVVPVLHSQPNQALVLWGELVKCSDGHKNPPIY